MGLISNVLSVTTAALEQKKQLYADLGIPLPGAPLPVGTQPPTIVPSTTYPVAPLSPIQTGPIGPGGTIPIPSPVPGIPLPTYPGSTPGTISLPPITLPGGVVISPPQIPLPGFQQQTPQTTTTATRVMGIPVSSTTQTVSGAPQLPVYVGPGVACPSGYHPNKSSYFTMAGYVQRGTKCVRNRRRNPLNPRALDRAISRITSAKRASKKLGRVTVRNACPK